MKSKPCPPLKPKVRLNRILVIVQVKLCISVLSPIILLINKDLSTMEVAFIIESFLSSAVILTLMHKKSIAFRTWYIISIVLCVLLNSEPMSILIFEIPIILWMFKSQYIKDNFE